MNVDRSLLATLQQRWPHCFVRQVALADLADEPAGAIPVSELEFAQQCPSAVITESACYLIQPATVDDDIRQLTGKVAIVSGAASGLGLAIARGMYLAGASVVLTDIDLPGLERVKTELAELATDAVEGVSRLAIAQVDVRDEAAVAAGFDVALSNFGKLDIMAACAGVAPPYKLVDFPVEKFRFANEINLTGYFLFGREAARIFTAQRHGGSMVLLSSKSGLEPSKANTAYNATKAGEIHMARGWALELGIDGIRVNCIAPGNVFEGSQIWNEEYIKVCAKKKGIEPEEVIPYYNSLTALNAEIKPDDIAQAAIYLASDAARRVTGQVLPVDAGQVWTR